MLGTKRTARQAWTFGSFLSVACSKEISQFHLMRGPIILSIRKPAPFPQVPDDRGETDVAIWAISLSGLVAGACSEYQL